jgi:hypothetical protein
MCELPWIEELFVVTQVSDDVFNIPNKVPQDLDIRSNLLFADIKVGLVLAG